MTFEDLQAYYATLPVSDKGHFSAALNGYVKSVSLGMPKSIADKFVSADEKRRVMPIVPEHKRLDAFARLVVGDQVCAAVAIKDKKLLIASNQHFHPEGSLLRTNVKKLCHYLRRGTPTKFINEYTTELSYDLINELFQPVIKKEFSALQESCNSLIAKNQKAGSQARFHPVFWASIKESSNQLFLQLTKDLTAGLYEHLSGKCCWSAEVGEPSVIGDVYEQFDIKLEQVEQKPGEKKPDPKQPKPDARYMDTFLDKEAYLKLMMENCELPEGVSLIAGKGDIPKKINIFIKKCIVYFVRAYTDLLLLMDYVRDDHAPLNEVLDVSGAEYDITYIEGLETEKGVHAEMRLLEYIKKQGWLPDINYIGIGKLCCPNCHLVLKKTAQYIDTESEFKELARGHHSNIPHWPITDYHRHDDGFLHAVLGEGFSEFGHLTAPSKTILLNTIELFYTYMNKGENLSLIGVNSSLVREGASSLTPLSLSSVAGLLPRFGLEYAVYRVHNEMACITGIDMCWNKDQLICIPYWHNRELIKGLHGYKDDPWSHNGSPYIADTGEIAKLQRPLYLMLLFCVHEFDSEIVKTLFKDELTLYQAERSLPDQIMTALTKESVTGNEVIRILYRNQDEVPVSSASIGRGKSGFDNDAYRNIDQFQIRLTPRGETTINDAMRRLGVDKEINAALVSLDRHLATPLDAIEEVKEDESDSGLTSTPFSALVASDPTIVRYDYIGHGIEIL